MVFYWLCEKPKIRILGEKFGISASTTMHELKNLLPKLIVAMQGSICWPHENLPSWMSAIGCINCTAVEQNPLMIMLSIYSVIHTEH
jgi:hypothetical protein